MNIYKGVDNQVWKDIDFRTGIVDLSHRLEKDSQSGKMMRVRGMKNKYCFRYLQLNESLLKELCQWKQEQKVLLVKMNIEQTENQFLFSFTSPKHGVNQPLERDWLNRKLRKVEQVYNLPHMTPHGFRHTFISDSLNAGVNQFSLKGIVGHSPVSNVTEHTYGHVNAQAQKSVFETVEAARRNGTLMVHSGKKEKHPASKTSA
ncbi:tyrosine-type recombinase/integrase [Lactococcus ileimucosae]|uniref:Tyrosine-type recombinase/integrase n=2 Tax=Lactococcus ileimucosae TaxID=2941329 RepID=A0ABV4D4F7_9LACT